LASAINQHLQWQKRRPSELNKSPLGGGIQKTQAGLIEYTLDAFYQTKQTISIQFLKLVSFI